jgi:hypothetical protein
MSVFLSSATQMVNDATTFFTAWKPLLDALKPLVEILQPVVLTIIGGAAALWAKKAKELSATGNEVAGQAVAAANAAANTAAKSSKDMQASLEQHTATQAFLVEKAQVGLEREKYVEALAIGEAKGIAKANSGFSNLASQIIDVTKL